MSRSNYDSESISRHGRQDSHGFIDSYLKWLTEDHFLFDEVENDLEFFQILKEKGKLDYVVSPGLEKFCLETLTFEELKYGKRTSFSNKLIEIFLPYFPRLTIFQLEEDFSKEKEVLIYRPRLLRSLEVDQELVTYLVRNSPSHCLEVLPFFLPPCLYEFYLEQMKERKLSSSVPPKKEEEEKFGEPENYRLTYDYVDLPQDGVLNFFFYLLKEDNSFRSSISETVFRDRSPDRVKNSFFYFTKVIKPEKLNDSNLEKICSKKENLGILIILILQLVIGSFKK